MAQYIRFEIYIPVVYSTKETDPLTGATVEQKRALDPRVLKQFIDDTQRKYQGITQVNPLSPALYKG